MSYSKRQYFPQDMSDGTPARRSRNHQKTQNTPLYENFRNNYQETPRINPAISPKKTLGSFAKTYAKKLQYNSKDLRNTSGNKFGKAEKLKLIKEFESTGAPISLFCKWYGIGMNSFRRWFDRFKKYGEAGLDDMRAGKGPMNMPADIKTEIVRLKLENPGIGAGKIAEWLARHRFFQIESRRVREVLLENPQTEPLMHEQKRLRRGNSGKEPQHFERSKPGDMYNT